MPYSRTLSDHIGEKKQPAAQQLVLAIDEVRLARHDFHRTGFAVETGNADFATEVGNVVSVNVHVHFDRFASSFMCRVVHQH